MGQPSVVQVVQVDHARPHAAAAHQAEPVWAPTPGSHVLDAGARLKEQSWWHPLGTAEPREGCEGEIPNCATQDRVLYVQAPHIAPAGLGAREAGHRVSNAVQCVWMLCAHRQALWTMDTDGRGRIHTSIHADGTERSSMQRSTAVYKAQHS